MIKEHVVSASITNGAECICNPEILLGTKFGLWDFENEQAPRGALMDLNAAWQLFLSRQGFSNVSFETKEHHQHEVIDGVVYEEGDTTYILKDDNGNPTGASFTVKANKGPVEHIEWEKGKLYLYYTKQRPLQDKDLQNGAPIHYVTDEDGTTIIDQETGKPLIYDYVTIPVLEIFDNDETRQLFPWYSDDNNVTHLRDSIDGRTGHLGSFSITPESEVYYAKNVDGEKNQDLISLQSVQKQINKDLGFEPKYEIARDYPDPDDGEYHNYRAKGSTLGELLHVGFGDKSSLLNAVNEDLVRTRINTRLIADTIVESDLDWQQLLVFADSIKNQAFKNSNVPNILAALNWMQTAEIGPFKEELNSNISKEVNGQKTVAEHITEALNIIFEEAEQNRDRIGYDRINKTWIELSTDKKDNLTNAINEVDQHTDALVQMVQVTEEWDPVHKKTYYSNPDLNDITKNRLRLGAIEKDDVTIVESINELQAQIGNLSQSKSNVNDTQLTTDNKHTVVEAINEVDLHADNNEEVLGAEYTKDSNGKKNSDIMNLQTTDKSSIVNAINELDARVGETEDLNTDDQSNIVNAINEVIKEQPFVYENVDDPESGVVLKDQSEDGSGTNHAGKHSLALGKNNDVYDFNFVNGEENISQGSYTSINGYKNTSKKKWNTISGKSNFNDGDYNLVNGLSNTVNGNNNIVSGSNNVVTSDNSTILGDNIYAKNADHLTAIGNSINVKDNTNNSIAVGNNAVVNGNKSIVIGSQNKAEEESVSIGIGNELEGNNNVILGENNFVGCEESYTFGSQNITRGDNDYVVGKNNKVTGNNNFVAGSNQVIEGSGNTTISAKQKVKGENAIVIGDITKIHNGATHIGGEEIYIKTHNTESRLQDLIFVNLNDWCKSNNASSLNGEKFLDTQHVINALKVYLTREYPDTAIIRFTMQEDDENGIIFVQGKTTRIYLKGSWFFTDNIENGWSRHEGEYLKVISKRVIDQTGAAKTKHYLALMDQLSTNAIVETVGGQRSNTEDFGTIDLSHAYGAVDTDDLETAMDLSNRFNAKVDKTARIITKYQDAAGATSNKTFNWIDPTDSSKSQDIILSLVDSFGFNKFDYQTLAEKGKPGGYVPLNYEGKINSDYLPSYVDDVIDVWAEYTVAGNQDLTDIHLYQIINDVDETGSAVIRRGEPILNGEQGKIYVEAQPKPEGKVSYQFRFTGTRFVAIGAHIVIGEIEGTAFDGGRGKALETAFNDHQKSGTTTVPVLNEAGFQKVDADGNPMWVTYKPNPHNVTAEQINVTVNDPNSVDNTELKDEFPVEYTLGGATKELFNRVNNFEDRLGSTFGMLGSPEDLNNLDELDGELDNNAPTLISLAINNKTRLDNIEIVNEANIDSLVNDHFILNPEG